MDHFNYDKIITFKIITIRNLIKTNCMNQDYFVAGIHQASTFNITEIS